jgi:hypothetical protein
MPKNSADQQAWKMLSRLFDRRVHGGSKRVSRLFLAACLRRLAHLPLGETVLRAIEALEQQAEGRLPEREFQKTRSAVQRVLAARRREDRFAKDPVTLSTDAVWGALETGSYAWGLLYPFHTAWRVLNITSASEDDTLPPGGRRTRRRALHASWAQLIREFFPDPEEPTLFDPRWRTPVVEALAGAAWKGGDFTILPILGDALEEAGCDQPALLDHLRWDGPHRRGCWGLDLVLGIRG